MAVTPLVPALPPLAAALGGDALVTLGLGLARLSLFPANDLGTRLCGAVHVTLAYATVVLARATATRARLHVARAAALSLAATAAALFAGVDGASALDAWAGGINREVAHAGALGLAAAYAFVTSPARRPPRSGSPTSRA